MKKLLPILLSAALALSGCSAPDASTPADGAAAPAETTEATEPATTAEPADDADTAATAAAFPVGTLYKLPHSSSVRWGFNTGEGYYEFAPTGPNNVGGLVVKTDYGTMVQAPVCQVEGCTHDSEACPAYLPSIYGVSLFVLDGEIYLYHIGSEDPAGIDADYEARLSQEGITDEQAKGCRNDWAMAKEPTFIDVISADGLSRRRLLTVAPEDDWFYRLYFCDGKALYGKDSYSSRNTPVTGVRLDLETGQVDNFPLLEQETPIDVLDGCLLTQRVVTDEPLPNTYDERYYAVLCNGQAELDLLNPATGERTQLYSAPVGNDRVEDAGYFANYQGRLYLFKYSSDGAGTREKSWVESYDPKTGEAHVLTENLPGLYPFISIGESGLMPVGTGMEKRYIYISFLDAGASEAEYRLDLETGEVYLTTQPFLNDIVFPGAQVMAETDDGRWLIGYQHHNDEIGRFDYALIDAQAFLQGSEEYEYVDMWP